MRQSSNVVTSPNETRYSMLVLAKKLLMYVFRRAISEYIWILQHTEKFICRALEYNMDLVLNPIEVA
jgi:hypothetical protein